VRLCIVYDCLFPWTVGGAERWYRNLAERLAADGHEVTYVTLKQWGDDQPPSIPGVRVIAVGPQLELYADGNRRIGPPIRFGLGVFLHLLRHGRDYDALHTASFPYFSLLAAAVTRPIGRFRISCDWHEVWSRAYWREYLGAFGGWIGWTVQRMCAWVPQRAYAFSRLHAARLKRIGLSSDVTVLTGEYAGSVEAPLPTAPRVPPTVVYAGRLIREKRVPLVVDAVAAARREIPGLRAVIFGAGPELDAVRARVADLGLEEEVELPGFVAAETVDDAMRTATCVVQPSSREGYGMVVVEASAHGVPAIVVAGEDNAAVELVDEGVNGFVAPVPTGDAISAAIVRCHVQGEALRESTRAWFVENARRLSIDGSLQTVSAGYSAPNARS
jgi:glycosyltransferase involved in cell wall biosynthesis